MLPSSIDDCGNGRNGMEVVKLQRRRCDNEPFDDCPIRAAVNRQKVATFSMKYDTVRQTLSIDLLTWESIEFQPMAVVMKRPGIQLIIDRNFSYYGVVLHTFHLIDFVETDHCWVRLG